MVIRVQTPPVRMLKFAAFLSLFIGTVLLAVKFTAYGLTGSMAILSDAAESIVNVLAAAIAFYSLKVAFKPADTEHPYGHGKVEFFSAAFEGGAIIAAAIWIIYKAVHDIFAGSHIHELDTGVILLVAATILNAALGYFLVVTGRKNKSLILEADGKHILTDVATSVGVIIGLILVRITGWGYLDSIIAIFVAANIIRTGWRLLFASAEGMMDKSSSEDESIIREVLDRHMEADICAYHKLRGRHSGGMHYIDFHLMLPRRMPIELAHSIATSIESEVASALGNAGVMAHIEPCKKPDCRRCLKE